MKQDFQPAPQAKSRFGCLGLGLGCGIVAVVGVVLLCGGGFVAAIFGVFGILKSSEPYTRSIATVTDSAEVQLRHFEPGEQVVVTDGPFVGVEAIYQMADAEGRVMVLLNILSKQVKMTVMPASIRKVN